MKKKCLSLLLACVLAAAPLMAACSNPAPPDAELPPEDVLPDVPEVPETPDLPDVPETPAPPADDGAPDAPEVPPENGEDAEEDVPAIKKQAQYILSRANGLNVRTGAGTKYASLGQVNAGDMLHFAGRQGNWFETRYRGKTAYVSADPAYTSATFLDRADDAVEAVIAEGLSLLGVPYVYGAVRLHDGKGNFLKNFTTNAFDCSSLMQYIFYRGAGVLLDVTTRTQVKQGVPVAWADIARGDLLFYTNAQRYNKTGVERIGHVALYLGDNYILHTASDYAVIEQMSATRRNYFVTARRVL